MWAERLCRVSLLVVLAAGVVAVLSGALSLVWSPSFSDVPAEPCTDPPCLSLDLNGVSPLVVLPFVAHLALLGIALALGAVALLLGFVAAARGHGRRLLTIGAIALAAPLLVLVGGELLPHLLNPCVLPELAGARPPGFCERSPEGIDVPDRWHALYHALVGFLPLSLAVGWWGRRLMERSFRKVPLASLSD